MNKLLTIAGLIFCLASPSISHAGRRLKSKRTSIVKTAPTPAPIASSSDLVFEKLFSAISTGHSVDLSCDGGNSDFKVSATLSKVVESNELNIHSSVDIYRKSDGSKYASADFVNPFFFAGQLQEHMGDSMMLGLNIGHEGYFVGGALSVYGAQDIQFSYQWLYDTAPFQITNCTLKIY